jgi:hypothetical protein
MDLALAYRCRSASHAKGPQTRRISICDAVQQCAAAKELCWTIQKRASHPLTPGWARIKRCGSGTIRTELTREGLDELRLLLFSAFG